MKLYIKEYFENLFNIIRFDRINLIATWSCDYRCKTCQAWKRNDHMMSREQAEQIINFPGFKKITQFDLEGGEATRWLLFDWFLIKLLNTHPKLKVGIPCNGLNTDHILKLFQNIKDNADYKRIQISISLNGIGKTHDKIRGVKGGFDKTMNTLVGLKEMNYNPSINFLPIAENFDELELIKNMPYPLTLVVPSGSGKFESEEDWADYNFPEYLNAVRDHHKTLKGGWKWALQYFVDHIEKRKIMSCYGARSFIAIYPKGDIRTCIFREDKDALIGQVYDNRIDIYKDKIKQLTKEIKCGKCMYPNGHLVCGGQWIPQSIRRNIIELIRWKIGLS